MKKIIVFLMAFGLSVNVLAQTNVKNGQKNDPKEVCKHENYGSNMQSKIAEKSCMAKDNSGIKAQVEKKVNEALKQHNSNEKDKKNISGSGSNSASTKKTPDTSGKNNKPDTKQECSSCSQKAETLKNIRKP